MSHAHLRKITHSLLILVKIYFFLDLNKFELIITQGEKTSEAEHTTANAAHGYIESCSISELHSDYLRGYSLRQNAAVLFYLRR